MTKTMTHTSCTHPATKAGRAKCRRDRAAQAQADSLAAIAPCDAAYCITCHHDDLPRSLLCDRQGIADLGRDRDADLVARFEGVCLRCCNHNHG